MLTNANGDEILNPMRIFVGCAANGEDIESQIVLDYTLRKHSSQVFGITWMQLSRNPQSPFYSDGARGWQTSDWATPFSGFRWAVPWLCGFKGRAIYLDSDFIIMDDIAKLWNQPLGGKAVMAKGGPADSWRFCCSLWDCEAAREMLPGIREIQGRTAHREITQRFRRAHFVGRFEGGWNCIDGEDYASLDDPRIKAIHYSSEAHQPQLKHAIPRLAKEGKAHWFDGEVARHWRPDLEDLFDRTLAEALRRGYGVEQYRPAEPFGAYQKASQANYKSHRWAKVAS